MKKKVFAALVAAALVCVGAAGLFGCGSSGGGSTAPSAPAGTVEITGEWTWETDYGTTYHFVEVTNTTADTIDFTVDTVAYGQDGSTVGSDSNWMGPIATNECYVVCEVYEGVIISEFESTVTYETSSFISATADINLETNAPGNGTVVLTVTNNGSDNVWATETYVLFFDENGDLCEWDWNGFGDMTPGASMTYTTITVENATDYTVYYNSTVDEG